MASREPFWEHGLGCCLCLTHEAHSVLCLSQMRWDLGCSSNQMSFSTVKQETIFRPYIYWENILRFFDWAGVDNGVVHKMIVSLGRHSNYSNTKKSTGNHYS